jgi:hypothetical protein
MQKAPYKQIEKPKVFVVLAGLMLVVTMVSYAFEEELYDIAQSPELFVLLISGSLVLALFFLTCYRVPRLGYRILGRESELGYKKPIKGGVSFNVFKSEDPSEVKILASARKEVRHRRRSFKNQKVQVEPKSQNDDADNKA